MPLRAVLVFAIFFSGLAAFCCFLVLDALHTGHLKTGGGVTLFRYKDDFFYVHVAFRSVIALLMMSASIMFWLLATKRVRALV